MHDLATYKQILEEVHTQYRSPEFYSHGREYPFLTLQNLEEMLQSEDRVPIFQNHLVGHSINDAAFFFERVCKERFPQDVEQIAISYLVATTLDHGTCQTLSDVLIYELMAKNVSRIENCCLQATESMHNHSFVIVDDDKQSPIAWDPLFNLVGPYNEHLKHPQVVDYFKRVTGNANWDSSRCLTVKTTYSHASYKESFPKLQNEINTFSTALTKQELEELAAIKENLNFAVSLNEDAFNVDEMRKHLKSIMSKRYNNMMEKLIAMMSGKLEPMETS